MDVSPATVWSATAQELLRLLDTGILAPKPRKASFYAPSFMHYRTGSYCSKPNQFPTVSVTGKGCTLNCKHCGGRILETMHPAETPEALYELSLKLKRDGALGCLVSGGCLPDGSVPLKRFIPVFARIKRELGLAVNVHTGIVDAVTAEALRNAGVDAALIDVIGSDKTISGICNLNVTVADYARSLRTLHEAGLNVVPHVIVGLQNGKLQGEFHALEMIARYKPSALVVIAFMPVRETAMALVEPPSPLDIARVAAVARVMFPDVPVALGCMRPKGKHRAEADVLCLKAGVDAVAFPSEEAIAYADSQGCAVSFSSYCCSQVFMDKNVE